MKIDQIVFPEMRVASVRRVGPYGPGVGEAFCKLVSWAGKNNLFDGNTLMLGAYWDCPKLTPPEQCRMDACITLSPGANPKLEEGLAIQPLPGGLCATYLCSVYNNDFRGCWDEFSTWLEGKEAQRDQRPCYEIYYGPCAEKHPLKKWVIDIVIPLKHQIT
ncbi:MAG: hypothetical protein A2X49_02415 [Lentisphaerae bacterium GWF2_52_8]|nr:MAG: hypothetical protein A2X49_02415 [Lentisphaerae bacterium GWF2_52_8]